MRWAETRAGTRRLAQPLNWHGHCDLHTQGAAASKDRAAGGDGMVLLVVEDDREMRSLLCDELWNLGVQIREAGDGDEALQCAMDSCPDLIITDLRMPAGGLDYLNRLHTVAPSCPIIVMTAFGDARTRDEALHRGAVAFFDKPVRMADLKATVARVLHLDGQGQEGTGTT